jgi:hypothetical protein
VFHECLQRWGDHLTDLCGQFFRFDRREQAADLGRLQVAGEKLKAVSNPVWGLLDMIAEKTRRRHQYKRFQR